MHSEYTKVFAAFDTSVYDEYHDLVFSFFSQELGERRKLETIKNLKKKLWEYVEEQNDDPEYPLFEQPKLTKNHEKKINEVFNSCLKKFEKADFISVTLPSIESLQPEFISNFPVDIIHIKKSQEDVRPIFPTTLPSHVFQDSPENVAQNQIPNQVS